MTDLLIEMFANELKVNPKSLSDESSPENTSEWDSLAAMALVSAIEDTFSVELSTKEIMKMRSIGIARQVLREKGVQNI